MKRRELETKDQMMYAEEPRQVAQTDRWDERRIAVAVRIIFFFFWLYYSHCDTELFLRKIFSFFESRRKRKNFRSQK